jgi:hypothetical protein
LEAEQQQRLGPFLLDMALLTNARNHDYAAVARLLGVALEQGLADGPLCAQAAELLQRVAASADGGETRRG